MIRVSRNTLIALHVRMVFFTLDKRTSVINQHTQLRLTFQNMNPY